MIKTGEKQDRIFINSTLAWCGNCKKVEYARIVADPEGVFMEKVCDKAGSQRTKLASDYSWYLGRMSRFRKIEPVVHAKKERKGCPEDCGLCTWHTTALHLPVFSITNDCNLNCPKCFTYNRPDRKYYKSIEETRDILKQIKISNPSVQLINMTGGEPTLHPQLFEIINVCREEGIKRITMNTNGLKIATDFQFAQKIKETGIQLVLSMDTLKSENSIKIYGTDIVDMKKKALETIEKLDIPTTLLIVCIKGINESEAADISSFYLKKSFIKSITIQNMTYTGNNGSVFEPREHITIDEVEKLLAVKEDFSVSDFFPLGSYHPLCYSVAYYASVKEKLIPLTKILGVDLLINNSKNCYLLEPDKNFSRDFLEGLNRLWAEGEDEEIILALKKTVKDLYPADREIAAEERTEKIESMTKMIYIHPHMDEDNFDIDRVSACGDLVPDESGRMVPACSYNLLYRQKDERFWKEEQN